jgi:hypothetical protein
VVVVVLPGSVEVVVVLASVDVVVVPVHGAKVVVDVDGVVAATVVDVGLVAGTVVEGAVVGSGTVEVGEGPVEGGRVVVVSVPEGSVPWPGTGAEPRSMGVVSPGLGFQPFGGCVCDGTGPGVGITDGADGLCVEGGVWAGTGVPGA